MAQYGIVCPITILFLKRCDDIPVSSLLTAFRAPGDSQIPGQGENDIETAKYTSGMLDIPKKKKPKTVSSRTLKEWEK